LDPPPLFRTALAKSSPLRCEPAPCKENIARVRIVKYS
jgi:hypothetical protein